MNLFVIATFASCFLLEYMARQLNLISVYFVLVPEMLAGLALLVVLGRLIVGQRLQLDVRYIFFLVLLVITMAMGVVVENVPAGAMVSGIRDYVPFLALLLLGAIYPFTARQIKTQLVVLGLLFVVQTPLAVYQRFVTYDDRMHTGDPITGTVTTSSALSILMVSGVAVLTVLYVKRRLSLPVLLIATAFLLLPTTLNETKATVVMLPIAMLVPLFCIRKSERPFRRLLPLATVFAATGIVFVSVYNTLLQEYRDPEGSIQEFWLEGGLYDYVYKGSVEGDHRVGRLDSLQLAVRGISESPLRAAFGLGIGNVSPAQLPGFGGDYAHYYDAYKIAFTQLSMLLWNLGFMGPVLFGFFFMAVFRDALLLARSEGDNAYLGQVWAPVTLIAAMCFLYKPILTMNEIAFPFMFYAGVVARRAWSLRREQRATRREPARAGPLQGAPAMARQ